MNKPEQLIRELCPEGVFYRKLNEIAEMKRGTSVTKENVTEGNIPVISGGKKPAYYCNKSNREGETITVAGSGAAGYVQYWNTPVFVCDAFSIKGTPCVDTKFLYYCLSNAQEYIYSTKKIGGVPHVYISGIENMEIPVPPLPVQREIVRILDQFTELEAELETELDAELEKREKQYEHYRRTLLKFEHSGETSRKTLGEIATIKRGSKPREHYEKGRAPFKYINAGMTPPGYVTSTNCKGNVVTTPSHGSSIGFIGFQQHDFWLGALCYQVRSKGEDVVLNRYLFHYLACHRDLILSCKKGGAIPALNLSDLKSIAVTFPPLPVQREIVRILDQFSTLCTDLTSGLPAEISARRKQYEYYREKLLTFRPILK